MSRADHPESDGQTERVNQILEDMLRSYVSKKQSNWKDYLPILEFAYNNSKHSVTGFTPFMLMYGFQPRSPMAVGLEKEKIQYVKDFLEDRNDMLKAACESIRSAQDRAKTYANKARRKVTFEKGDFVFLKVPAKSETMKTVKCDKLSPRYYGPFKILKKIGDVAYKLELLESSQVHSVFHVKFERQKAPGLLQPLPIPDKPWESIARDFIFDLPRTPTRNDKIWTIICRFSKQAHFVPVRKKIKSDYMVKLFMHNIFKYHGMPQSIVSDRDPRMTSLFWKILFENMGFTFEFSSSFHPQIDGQSEEANSTVLDLLKCCVRAQGNLGIYLPLVEQTIKGYSEHMKLLAQRLLSLISESLGLKPSYIQNAIGEPYQNISLNYYPPCPQPELTLGLQSHSDLGAITLLLQDDVGGLQVCVDGTWFAVQPIPGALVVNLADQLQILSNGRYKSIEHRAVVNQNKSRISIATFYDPAKKVVISPASELVGSDHPAMYKDVLFGDHVSAWYGKGPKGKKVLESLCKIDSSGLH
ncbi:hypothetical protein L7F22_062968 [Adiantum nelumboides]|nr:hypothetical protein [Adiantum nelumboides]